MEVLGAAVLGLSKALPGLNGSYEVPCASKEPVRAGTAVDGLVLVSNGPGAIVFMRCKRLPLLD